MLKNKISVKLAAYFAICLLVFATIIGSVFMLLFRNYTIEVHRGSLERRAVSIAETVASYATENDGSNTDGQSRYRDYMAFWEAVALPDVWIIDQNRALLTPPDEAHRSLVYGDLPADADAVIQEVFGGKTSFSSSFGGVRGTPTLTVGTPVWYGGAVVGVVLLHSSIGDTDAILDRSFAILGVSIVVALLLSVLMAILFSCLFTRPLNRMKNTALRLADGDYTGKNGLRQRDEIGELARAMDILADRLQETSGQSEALDRLRRDFVANVSHEVRTPVTVLRGSLEALVDGVVTAPSQVESYHREMLAETIHMQRLVGDLLDLSHLQNADFAIKLAALDLADVIDDAVRGAAHLAREKCVTIAFTKSDAPRTAYADYGRLRQMLLIILDNAVKFSPAHASVEITLDGRSITIRDHGAGVPPQDLPYIFERFYKGAAENNNGTGLGLAIAKQIADRHGATISVRNALDGGASFEIIL